MDTSPSAPPAGTVLTRALCLLMLFLMAGAAVYGGYIALHNFRQIGV